jgi:hypothetical protein
MSPTIASILRRLSESASRSCGRASSGMALIAHARDAIDQLRDSAPPRAERPASKWSACGADHHRSSN